MDKVPYLLKRNVFSHYNQELIFNELRFLKSIMRGPEFTDSATIDNKILKSNKGIFFHHLYTNPSKFSPIWKLCSDKIKKSIVEYREKHITNRNIMTINNMWVLASYYEKGDYYLPHRDQTIATALFWFNEEKFDGGDLTFDDTNETVKYENNSMIIFPSWAKHGVNKVSHEGRYCVTIGLLATNK
tara:strand:- start:31 stop:588 length:558 start_codon:yes stop_codon:yes gene_type:complete